MKKFFSLFAAILFAGSMMAAEVEIANATFNGKNATYTAGWTTTGTGLSRTDCVIIGKDENITSPSIDLSAYKSISITFKARRYGSLSGSKATISVAYGGAEIGTIDVTSSSVGDVSGSIDYNVPDGLAASSFVFTCTNATSAGSTHGAGIGAITITGDNGGETVVANFCQTEIGHFAAENADPNSFVLLSIGSKGGKTIVRIDQDSEKNTQMFDYLQVTGLASTGEDVAEGGVAAMAVEFDTPALTNDSMTLEILWSTVNWPGRWMVQNLRVAVAECEYAVIPKAPLVPKTCAEVYSMAKNDEVALSEVTVTYVNGKNVYVKDESGAMLLYLPANATWKAGDKLAGIEGVVDIYNGLYEIKPTAEQVAAVVATAGEAPAPVELAVAPVAADVNKYVILKGVSVAAGEFTTAKATNLDLTIGDATVVLRNNFKLAQVFDADAKYNIVAAVAIYNTAIQLYFISAEEIVVPQLNVMAYGLKASEVVDGKVTIDYSLNAKATAVEIQLLNAEGEAVKTFDATGLKKGANQEVLDLEGVAAGTYNWAVKATAKPNNAAEPVKIGTFGEGHAMGRAVALDKNPESPYYGNVYSVNGQAVGLIGWDAALNPLFDGKAVASNGWGSGNSAPCRAAVGEDGLVYLCDWSDSNPNVRIFNPATPEAEAKDAFGGKASGTDGIMVNESGDTIHGSMSYAMPFGSGENTYLVTVDEDYKIAGKLTMYKYAIGTAATPFTGKPEVALAVGEISGGAIANANVTFAPSKGGGWWVSQHRYSDATATPSLAHISAENTVDYKSNATFANATVGYNNQASFDINNDESIIVTSTSNAVFSIVVSEVAWTDGVPAVTPKYTIPTGFNNTCLKVAIDEAGNVYGIAAAKPLTIWALPKAENNCTTPAAKASKIVVTDTGTALDNSLVPVKVQKVIVDGQVVIIKDGKTYNVMGQIVR